MAGASSCIRIRVRVPMLTGGRLAGAEQAVQVTYDKVKEVRAVSRGFGLWGDLVRIRLGLFHLRVAIMRQPQGSFSTLTNHIIDLT